ncbi:MAG: protein kinase [Flavobacteriales bacterium]|nr:protein kinase [Flavobacteriales bacterium]
MEQLHKMGYYHRDIKPDNILFFGGDTENEEADSRVWKIGDLGLIEARDKDNLDRRGERIGPFGWISPEAGNKFMTEKYNLNLDCKIDEKSDVFQLGKLMWFIFQHNIPIGIIDRSDLTRSFDYDNETFASIVKALQHGKARRYDMAAMGADLKVLAQPRVWVSPNPCINSSVPPKVRMNEE